jgi:predicted esterase
MAIEKRVTYKASNTYATLNTITAKTKNVWLVFHGMGYLSTYFIRHFSGLSQEENYIIAPQAPSKYYQSNEYKHVGASWLTRIDTVEETKNVLAYVDEVWMNEKPQHPVRFIIVGYSQGVSIATRWMASRKIKCDHLVLHSGGIPKELKSNDFDYLASETKVSYLYGNQDEYITEAKKTEESLIGSQLFGDRLSITMFQGVHEVYPPFFKEIVYN